MFDFNKNYFEKNQKTLLWIANHWISRWLLGLNRLPKQLKGKIISQVNPTSICWATGKHKKINGKVKVKEYKMAAFTSPRFSEALAYNLSPFAYLKGFDLKQYKWQFSPVGLAYVIMFGVFCKKFFGLPLPFFGTVGGPYYSRPGDGQVTASGTTSWDTYHNATSGTADYTSTEFGWAGGLNGSTYTVRRAFVVPNASGLPDDATIQGGTIYLCASSNGTAVGSVGVVNSTQASSESLTANDFDNCGDTHSPTEGATRIAHNTIVENEYFTITLNATGYGWISKTAYTYFGLRSDSDLDDSAPSTVNGANVWAEEATGTSQDPYLEVTYTETTLNSNFFALF